MSTFLKGASLFRAGLQGETNIYRLRSGQLKNRYFILSGEGTRHLMASPEVVGYDSYLAMLEPTADALQYLFPQGIAGSVDILTILRGGLNYPLEEACHRCGLRVCDIHFVSCERIIENNIITGLDIKYEKLRVKKDCTLLIGDIIATGDTLTLCLDQIADRFRRKGGSIRRIVMFTIGGTRAIKLLEEKRKQLQTIFPGFEGFDCLFYEGIFSIYEDKGVSGINVPDIDFGWKGGVVAPEFRSYVLEHPWSLLEKCIIYDGGARRYEIPLHFEEVLEYWHGILESSGDVDPAALVGEKLGYAGPISYDKWLEVTYLKDVEEDLHRLWEVENTLLEYSGNISLKDVATDRINAVNTKLKLYE